MKFCKIPDESQNKTFSECFGKNETYLPFKTNSRDNKKVLHYFDFGKKTYKHEIFLNS